MNVKRPHSGVWFQVLLAAGAALAIALLVQTIVNYRYVSNSLTLQEARRVAEERVRNVERTARLARPQDADAFQVVLDDIRADTADQLAAIALLRGDGTVVASSGQPSTAVAPQRGRVTGRDAALAREWRAGREVVFVVLPCRCGLPRQPAERAEGPPPAGRLLVEVGLYRDRLTAPFARLRRHAIISSSAALALLVSVLLIAAGSGSYVRGKQLEVEMDLRETGAARSSAGRRVALRRQRCRGRVPSGLAGWRRFLRYRHASRRQGVVRPRRRLGARRVVGAADGAHPRSDECAALGCLE